MNVLIDRHHAGLFHSLQLLGDRLGWTIYTPVGREWWDAGYWRFGEGYGDERLVDQYLSTADVSWSHWQGDSVGTFWETRDRDYPDRTIHGMTLERARKTKWRYVMATVQDNQAGFARFARSVGADYVYQVGNTRQAIDWSLDPLVIASSEVPLVRGVRYLQEMHPAFAFRPPSTSRVITSLVQYMPRMECWPFLSETVKALPDYDWRIHGAGCPDGLINPTTAVADTMAEAGFGWHDKITGDGFGHVLWGWAAIGRPVIGHARHYAGQLGEVLWTPETSIDLDTQDAVEILRTMTPERHAQMCEAMRRTFETYYDPARDAQAIKEFLA